MFKGPFVIIITNIYFLNAIFKINLFGKFRVETKFLTQF